MGLNEDRRNQRAPIKEAKAAVTRCRLLFHQPSSASLSLVTSRHLTPALCFLEIRRGVQLFPQPWRVCSEAAKLRRRAPSLKRHDPCLSSAGVGVSVCSQPGGRPGLQHKHGALQGFGVGPLHGNAPQQTPACSPLLLTALATLGYPRGGVDEAEATSQRGLRRRGALLTCVCVRHEHGELWIDVMCWH